MNQDLASCGTNDHEGAPMPESTGAHLRSCRNTLYRAIGGEYFHELGIWQRIRGSGSGDCADFSALGKSRVFGENTLGVSRLGQLPISLPLSNHALIHK